jgi:ribosome-associated protein
MLKVNETLSIPDRSISIRYVRSRGPGGQNVNKVNTRAQLTFDLKDCLEIPPAPKQRLRQLAGRRLNQKGELLLESDRFREQNKNRQEVLNRLRRMIRQALIKPKLRRPTKPTRASKRKTKATKQHRGKLKSLRKSVPME